LRIARDALLARGYRSCLCQVLRTTYGIFHVPPHAVYKTPGITAICVRLRAPAGLPFFCGWVCWFERGASLCLQVPGGSPACAALAAAYRRVRQNLWTSAVNGVCCSVDGRHGAAAVTSALAGMAAGQAAPNERASIHLVSAPLPAGGRQTETIWTVDVLVTWSLALLPSWTMASVSDTCSAGTADAAAAILPSALLAAYRACCLPYTWFVYHPFHLQLPIFTINALARRHVASIHALYTLGLLTASLLEQTVWLGRALTRQR